jgi:hypothetical protein
MVIYNRVVAEGLASFLFGVLALGLAIATSFLQSPVALLFALISIALACVLGIIARVDAKRQGNQKPGVPLGMILGFFALVPILVGASEAIRWTTVRFAGANNLVQIGVALQAYQKAHGSFPPAATHDEKGRPLLSWRVLILPYLYDQQDYDKFHLHEPWDSPHNKGFLDSMPGAYRTQPGNPVAGVGSTFYQMFVGANTVGDGIGISGKDIEAADGCANTIVVVEGAESVPWTKAEDLVYDSGKPLPRFADFYKNEFYGRAPRGRFLALFADGSVRGFFNDTPDALLRPLITWDGGEKVDWKELEPWCPGPEGQHIAKPQD